MRHALLRLTALVAAIALPGLAAAQPPPHAAPPAHAAHPPGAPKLGPPHAAPYDLFVTFGDSLADTGNLFAMTQGLGFQPAVPPSRTPHRTYFEGRFSNGPVAFEYLWNAIRGGNNPLTPVLRLGSVPRKGGVDFSFGGSSSGFVSQTPGSEGFFVPGLRGQVELYLALKRGAVPKRTLAAIVTGSNDYLTTPPTPPASPPDVVANIVAAIERLHAAGVNTIVVLNLSDLGAVPLVSAQPPEQRAGLTALSTAHNVLLAHALEDLSARRPKLRLVPVDVNEVIAGVPGGMNFDVPAVDTLVAGWPYPFPASACLFVDATTCPDVPTLDVGDAFFFWDAVHPTTAVHGGLAGYLLPRLP